MSDDALFEAAEATWPPATARRMGPWTIREGQGGGKRVSAATAHGPATGADIAHAEAAMRALGQTPLFMVRPGQNDLDAALAARGYDKVDPVVIYRGAVADLAREAPPPVSAFHLWPPLHIMEELWQEAGIDPGRRAVMDRAAAPKTAILGRTDDRAVGVAFAACHGKTAFLHALDVAETHRRQKTAVNMLREAAIWAQDQGAVTLVILVTEANAPARALYASLNMKVVGNYHYRMAPDPAPNEQSKSS